MAQHDAPPGQDGAANYVPYELWLPGDKIRDVHRIHLHAPLPAGSSLAVGAYDSTSQERLRARDPSQADLLDDVYRVAG